MWSGLYSRDARLLIGRWCRSVAIGVWVFLTLNARAFAHDLAIDQVMLWPDRQKGELRGELTLDPELTRSKDAAPSEEHARRVLEFVNAHLQLTLDRRPVALALEIRELWVRGGATLGDVVRFKAPLSASDHELRLHAAGFAALVVSVQRVPARAGSGSASVPPGRIETASWLLGKDDWTPAYGLDTGWQASGWREGGPDVFSDAAPPELAPARDAPRSASSLGLAVRFVRLGFEHILPGGVAHVLFVAGLVLAGARRYRQILISLSLFTLAHSVTLALGSLQIAQVSPQVVEPLIAFSIFVLGADNLRARRSVETPPGARYALVFCFGLVHGLGFASALSELSFDADHLLLALSSFNVGVELGQVAVVALLALLLHAIRQRQKLEQYATLAGSAAIAVSGLVMVIERVGHADAAAAPMTAPLAPPVALSSAAALASRPRSPASSPATSSLPRSL